GEPPTLFEPRILDLLAIIATIHLACAGWASGRPRGWWLAFAGQLLLFIFCYHARSSLAWEAIFIVMGNCAAIAWTVWRPSRSPRSGGLRFVVFGCGMRRCRRV